jgi:hypothetical protein
MAGLKSRTGTALPLVYPVIFTPSARAEMIEAQDWYERESPGLGTAFSRSD